jgi:hypothetical protein
MNNHSSFNPKFIILIVVIVIILIIAIAVGFKNSKKTTSTPTNPQSTQNLTGQPSGPTREGVFVSFSATAQGKVTAITDSSIEIEYEKSKKNFKLANNLFIVKKPSQSIFAFILDKLIPEANAEAPTVNPPSPNPHSPSSVNTQTVPPAINKPALLPTATTGSGAAQLKQKNIKDIKVGDTVTLMLTKQKEADDWVVTSIFITH